MTTPRIQPRIDPELRRIARFLPTGYHLNRGLRVPRALMSVAGHLGARRDVEVATVSPEVTVRVHRPSNTAPDGTRGPALLWLHGGGTIMGTAGQEDLFCRKLVNFTGISVVAVEYRLAPENPYPTPLYDCHAAYRWLLAQPWVAPDRVAVGGASAGGGLSAALAQHLHDRGEQEPALQLLVYPMLDDRTGPRFDDVRRPMWSGRDNQIAWRWYLGDTDPTSAVPARRADLSGLAPTWIGVGDVDLFHDECRDYAQRLTAAGVPTTLHSAPGAFHAFDLIAPNAGVSQRFFADQCRALREALLA